MSLVFGGLLWPLAWIWAYTKPVVHKLAYGTDRATDGHGEPAYGPPDAAPGAAPTLGERIARLEAALPAADLDVLRADLAAIESKMVPHGGR